MKQNSVLKVFDAAEHLETEEDRRVFLEESFESGNPAVILRALATVARSRNLADLARQADITREGFYRALNGGNPTLDTFTRILAVMGYQIAIKPMAISETIGDASESRVAKPVKIAKRVVAQPRKSTRPARSKRAAVAVRA